MLTRRRLLAAGALGTAGALTGCASIRPELARADLSRQAPDLGSTAAAVDAVGAFGADLLEAVSEAGNVVCSPFSVLIALAMVRQGAIGQTAREMDETLHLPRLDALNAGLNALDQILATRAGRRKTADNTRAKVEMDLANRVWGQRGSTWEPAFLAALATSYGTGVGELDIAGDPEGARKRLNTWVADQTHERIANLLPQGSVTPLTRLLLANALYVKAPWHERFQQQEPKPFLTPGGPVQVPMMGVSLRQGGLVGPGWQAARIPLAGRELALTVILPRGDLAALRRELSGTGLTRLLRTSPTRGVGVSLPPLRLRSSLPLNGVLIDLGMPRAFSELAEFGAITTSEPLHIGVVQHQGWIAVDEQGLEAAAATAVTVDAVSAPARPPLKLIFDRPFLACVHDVETGLPLLVLQVSDPSLTSS